MKNANDNFFSLKSKRVRRTKGEISRSFRCNIDECRKSYGTEGALKMHVKLKHERPKFANRGLPRLLVPLPYYNSIHPSNAALVEEQLIEEYHFALKNQYLIHQNNAENFLVNDGNNNLINLIDTSTPHYFFNEYEALPSINNEGIYHCNVMKLQCGSWQIMSSSVSDINFELQLFDRKMERIPKEDREESLFITMCNPLPCKLQISSHSIVGFAKEDLLNGFEIFGFELSFPPTFYSLENIDYSSSSSSNSPQNFNINSFDHLESDVNLPNDFTLSENLMLNNDKNNNNQNQMKWIETADFTGGNMSTYRIILLQLSKATSTSLLSQLFKYPYLHDIYHHPQTCSELQKVANNISKNESSILYRKYNSSSLSSSPSPPSSLSSSPSYLSSSPSTSIESPPLSRIRENFLQNINNTPPYPSRKLEFDSSNDNFIGDLFTPVIEETKNNNNNYHINEEEVKSSVKKIEKLSNIVSSLGISINDLSECSMQNLLSTIEKYYVDFEAKINLPCLHCSLPLQTLLTPATCPTCLLSYYYSFCLQTVVLSSTHRHCNLCNECYQFPSGYCENIENSHRCLLLL